MSEGKKQSEDVKTIEPEHCPLDCEIGLEDCAECGLCEQCPDGAEFSEEELPTHWQLFIEKSKKTP